MNQKSTLGKRIVGVSGAQDQAGRWLDMTVNLDDGSRLTVAPDLPFTCAHCGSDLTKLNPDCSEWPGHEVSARWTNQKSTCEHVDGFSHTAHDALCIPDICDCRGPDQQSTVEDLVWRAVEATAALGPLNGMSAMLLTFEAWGISVTRTVSEDKRRIDWRINL